MGIGDLEKKSHKATRVECVNFLVQGRKGLQIMLSCSQAGPGRKAKQGQEEISIYHVPAFFLGSAFRDGQNVRSIWPSLKLNELVSVCQDRTDDRTLYITRRL